MKRSFADYILYFVNERNAEGSLARLAQDDPSFPEKERDDKKVYTYLINSATYTGYTDAIVFLYHRYLTYSK